MFKGKIIAWAKAKSVSLKLHTLRQAIKDADKDKSISGRKNIVVYNTTKKEFEPIQKKILKAGASVNRGKKSVEGARKRSDGSKIATNGNGGRLVTYERIKTLEKNSLYATR